MSTRPAVLPALALACLTLLSGPAHATWSIVLVDHATGEVGIAGATCLEALDLKAALPVLVVGQGGACAQSAIDTGGTNRKKIFQAFLDGIPADQIIDIAKEGDLQKCARQYGVADINGLSDAFTGACAGQFKGQRVGLFGTIAYAVQGNVLTGLPVIVEARDALIAAEGNLAERLLAGMEAARAMGGDGRCSCLTGPPASCGSPPPEFEKSSHIAFMVVGRIGDPDGNCSGAGCATGDYWLDFNVIGVESSPDPVFTLFEQYGRFHAAKQGEPDGLLSGWSWDEGADPQVAELHVSLNDIDGQPVGQGGYGVTVEHAEGSAGQSPRQTVVDHGDGTYTIRVLRGEGQGTDRFQVTFLSETGRATLFPWPELEPVAPADAPPAGPVARR